MMIQDDRLAKGLDKTAYPILIGGTDRMMSGWGEAEGGRSYAFWACPDDPKIEAAVRAWVEGRRDLSRVRVTVDDGGRNVYRPKGRGHCHIYVAGPKHPSRTGLGGYVAGVEAVNGMEVEHGASR